jgi:hypothetical protein
MKIVIVASFIESAMHGAVYFTLPLKRGRLLTARYSDGTEESAIVEKSTADAIRAYHRYATENGAQADCPSTFSLISEIQSHRKAKGNA